MRGKAPTRTVLSLQHGITPAYAGKSIQGEKPVRDLRDHPRLCGEKYATGLKFQSILGSPPPMRGKERYFSRLILTNGITPAYAGKSSRFRRSRRHHRGSPPPMRGKEYDRS